MGIYETIQQLESMRKKLLITNYVMIGSFACMFIIPLFLVVIAPGTPGAQPILMLVLMVPMIISVRRQTDIKGKYKELYKSTFVRQVLQDIFDNVYYDGKTGFPSQLVKDMSLCRMGNRFATEDYLSGSYKGVRFEQADVRVQYHTSGKNSHTTTYFEGRMFIFDYPYKKVFSVQVFSENFQYRCKNPLEFKTNKVHMESEVFNREFDVMAVQDVDAFYVLTPQMLEKITMIRNRYGNVALHFNGNKLFVGINCGMNAFDGNPKRPIDYNTERRQAYEDGRVIMDIIEALEIRPAEEPDW